jgi:hypothetical protein
MEKKIKVLKQQFFWLKFLSTLGSGRGRGMMNKCRPTILAIILFSHLTKSKEYEIPAITDEQVPALYPQVQITRTNCIAKVSFSMTNGFLS